MGYRPEMINMAMYDSKNKSLEEVLDLLLFKEDKYDLKLSSKSTGEKFGSKHNVFEDLEVEKGRKNSHKGKGKNQEKKVPKKDSFKEENNGGINNNNVAVQKHMDDESALYVNTIRKSILGIDSKDPMVYVFTLAEHLKKIKFDTSDVGKAVHKYLMSGNHFNQIVDLRKKVYDAIMKVMTMKRQCEVDAKDFEYVLLMSFETRVLNLKQMDIILTTYNKFCNKMCHKQDEVLISSLEKYYNDAKNGTALDQDSYLLTDIAILKCPNVTNVKAKAPEETKISDLEGNDKAKKSRNEKEFCILCMDKTREIVFLPCCHFLTCPSCSPKVSKCPICEKKIEKNLKIFWS